jgi:hypothetical protein
MSMNLSPSSDIIPRPGGKVSFIRGHPAVPMALQGLERHAEEFRVRGFGQIREYSGLRSPLYNGDRNSMRVDFPPSFNKKNHHHHLLLPRRSFSDLYKALGSPSRIIPTRSDAEIG